MAISVKNKDIAYRFQLAASKEAIRLALANSETPVVTTKFTEDSAVFLHLLSNINPDITVLWIDTGYNTRATLEFSKALSARLCLHLRTFHPQNHTIIIPPELDSPEHNEFVHQVKLEPFKRAMAHLKPDVWLSSIRRYQSAYRNTLSVFDQTADGLLKVSPLLDWSPETVQRYSDEYALPSGPTCYDPTKGEPFRECGLHLGYSNSENSATTHRSARHA